MPKVKIVHYYKPTPNELVGSYRVVVCSYAVPKEQATTNLNEVTCKRCLNTPLSAREKLKMCVSCEDNFYNGNNPYNVKECWSLGKAKIVRRKKVGINDVPPWEHTPIVTLSCYRQRGYVFVEADRRY